MMRMTTGLSAMTLAALIQASGAYAQGGAMAKPMPMAKEKSYTGCVAEGKTSGSYTLSNAIEDAAMGSGAMNKDAMGMDAMGKGAMGKGAMAHSLSISSSTVDLSRHVGHKVTVTVVESGMTKPDAMAKHDGMGKPDAMAKDGMAKADAMAAPAPAMTVTSLKMVAATCGK